MDAPTLEYAALPQWYRRRKSLTVTFVAAVMVSVFVSAAFVLQIPYRVEVQLLQRRCLAHAPPARQVVFDETVTPFAANELRAAIANEWPPTTRPEPAPVQQNSHVPRDWANFYGRISSGLVSKGTVFLHEMKNGAGQARLVALDVVETAGELRGPRTLRMCAHVIVPGTMYRPPREAVLGVEMMPAITLGPYRRCRIYAGTLDAANGHHFIIRLDVDGHERVLDGWLSESDNVVLEPQKE